MGESVFFQISLIIITCAVLSWGALLLRQPIIVAYLIGGFLCGTSGFGLIHDTAVIDGISDLGITLLLFLAGIVLHPRRLNELLRQTLLLTLINSATAILVCSGFCLLWGFRPIEAFFIGLPFIFSSTILVIKLLPTTALHHKRMGAYCIAILIAQDIIAVTLLILIGSQDGSPMQWLLLPVKGIALIAAAFAFEQLILRRAMARCDRFHEILQLLALGWCLLLALISDKIGLSHEIGAFVAGVALARSPLAFFLSEQLKPFRDFFLVFFFFVLGTQFNPSAMRAVALPALILCPLMMASKYGTFRWLFRRIEEDAPFAHETGARLAQASEFSLILVIAEQRAGLLSVNGFQLVQLVTVLSMLLSSYLVTARFPSPLASNPKLKQD